MSMGPLSGLSGALGSGYAQRTSADTERRAQDVDSQQRETKAETKAEQAAGIGQTDGDDHDTNDRDADGRRLWEAPPTPRGEQAAPESAESPENPPARDPNGERGNLLDLRG